MLTKEELKGTFIRYAPEITEEIFNKIIKKLEDLGFKEYMGGNKFKDFCEKDKFICIVYQEVWFINAGFSPSKEIQVSDILGEAWNKNVNSIFKKDLEIGKIYRFDWLVEGNKCAAICKYTDSTFQQNEILFLHSKRYQKSGDGLSASFKDEGDSITFATQEEIAHLVQCREAGEYVEYNPHKETFDYPFKIGETVKLVSTGSSVGATIDGKKRYSAKKGDIVTITGITTSFGNASKHDPRYYGENFNVRGEDLEKIQESEETYKICETCNGEGVTSEEFVLPKNWKVAVTEESQSILGKWIMDNDYEEDIDDLHSHKGYQNNKNCFVYPRKGDFSSANDRDDMGRGYTEITFEQFKEHILKEKRGEMERLTEEELLEEAKRKYPIGTEFKSVLGGQCTISVGNYQWHKEHNCLYGDNNTLYKDGVWAEITSSPKEIEKWSVGSYVVFLEDYVGNNSYKKGKYQKIKKYEHKGFGAKGHRICYEDGYENATQWEEKGKLKWFATKEEAEAFAATLTSDKKEEMQFKVGKWYKNLGSKENYIAKFKELKGKNWHCESYIYNNTFSSEECSLTAYFSNAIECSLEEIQEYLPDGHVDKTTKSIGSWCVKITKDNRDVVVRWMDDRSFSFSIGAYYGVNTRGKKYGYEVKTYYDREISTEEFYKKIGHKVEELKWEVGAYVRYKGTKVSDDLWEDYFGKYGVVKGDVGIIRGIFNSEKWYHVQDNIRRTTSGNLMKEDLELITKEEYERGLRKSPTDMWKTPTFADLSDTPKTYFKEPTEVKTKIDKIEVQLIDVPRI